MKEPMKIVYCNFKKEENYYIPCTCSIPGIVNIFSPSFTCSPRDIRKLKAWDNVDDTSKTAIETRRITESTVSASYSLPDVVLVKTLVVKRSKDETFSYTLRFFFVIIERTGLFYFECLMPLVFVKMLMKIMIRSMCWQQPGNFKGLLLFFRVSDGTQENGAFVWRVFRLSRSFKLIIIQHHISEELLKKVQQERRRTLSRFA